MPWLHLPSASFSLALAALSLEKGKKYNVENKTNESPDSRKIDLKSNSSESGEGYGSRGP